MSYQILYNEEDGIVQITFSGTAVSEDHYAVLNAATRLLEEKKTSRLLLDFTDLTTNEITTMESFSFAKTVAGIRQRIYIAHVLSACVEISKKICFVSNVEANRGVITREFENVEDAKAWLRSIASD